MPVDAIVGLQYGSEGKGKVAAALAGGYQAAVRVGAPNAGHSVIYKDMMYKMRQVPCAWVNPHCKLFIGAGGLINMDVLKEEFTMLPEEVQHRFWIDRNAGMVLPQDIDVERKMDLNSHNGSTTEGIGSAQARKVLRKDGLLAKDVPELERHITNVMRALDHHLSIEDDVMLEGTQGYGLCLNHGDYPFVTSRDILVSSLLSDSGIAPKHLRHTYGVIRTYPIRVAGNSGPTGGKELSWEEVGKRAGITGLVEKTTVTKRVRRVFEFDWDLVQDACIANGPDGLFVTFADYLDVNLRGLSSTDDLASSPAAQEFVRRAERMFGTPVIGLSTGPDSESMIYIYPQKLRRV